MSALVRSDLQYIWLDSSIKSSPMKMIEWGMQFTSNCRHSRYSIVLILKKRFNSSKDIVVVWHMVLSYCWYLRTCFLLYMGAFHHHPTSVNGEGFVTKRSECISKWIFVRFRIWLSSVISIDFGIKKNSIRVLAQLILGAWAGIGLANQSNVCALVVLIYSL